MKKTDFEIIESKRWKHSSGLTASIYGAVPWTSEADKNNWTIETIGFTLRNIKTGTVGIGRKPFETYQDAVNFLS
jgi:hypothetical protein